MERLTERITEATIELSAKANPFQYNVSPQRVHMKHPFWNVFDRLCKYEDAEEQGLLIELPCKVGTVVFCIFERRTKCTEHNQEFDEYSCQGCECLECDSRKEKYVHEMKAYSLDWIIANINNFGKTVFLTRSEAEEALAKMGGKHE